MKKIDLIEYGHKVGNEECSRVNLAKSPKNFQLMRIIESLGFLSSDKYKSSWHIPEPNYNKFHGEIGDGYIPAYEKYLSESPFDLFSETAIRILHFFYIHNINVDNLYLQVPVTPLLTDSRASMNELLYSLICDITKKQDELSLYKNLLKVLSTIHHWFIIHSSRDMFWHINARLYYKKLSFELLYK